MNFGDFGALKQPAEFNMNFGGFGIQPQMHFNAFGRPEKPENFYAITCPNTLRSNSDFTVIASVHKSTTPIKMKVSIEGPQFSVAEIVEIQPYNYEKIIFSIPSIKEGRYLIVAEGLSGLEFKKSEVLEYSPFDSFVLIQTDKATYKPGDLVRFRSLILDKETRPAKIGECISITITDPQQNIIKKVNDAKFIKGVYSDEIQLSKFPNLGQWKITIDKNGINLDSSNFEVDKYVLPKFEMSIDVPRNVYKESEMLNVIVRAKYTYGKPVKGEATIKIKDKWGAFLGSTTLLTKTTSLDGKSSFEINLANELNSAKILTMKNYEIEAFVEEALTGSKIEATTDFNIHVDKYKIEGVSIPKYFIEELPVDITIVVKNYDGSPVQDTLNPVTITIEPQRRWKSFTFNKTEEKEMTNIIFEKKLDKNGMVTVNFTPLKDVTNVYSIHIKYLNQKQSVGPMYNLISKSNSPFQLNTLTEMAQINKDVTMQITSRQPLKYFFYQIIARGSIVEVGKIDVPEDRTYCKFKFRSTLAMVPSCSVFVYYIRDGEVASAEKRISVEHQLNSFIKINAPTKAKAGDEVEIKVSAKPDSYVGLLGVDQSVLLLKSGNDLNKENVVNGLKKFENKQTRLSISGRKIPGLYSGIVTVTNAEFERNERQYMQPQSCLFGAAGGGVRGVGAAPQAFGGTAKRMAIPATTLGSFMNVSKVSTFCGPPVPQVEIRKRKDFPETWLWSSMAENHNGEVIVRKKVPDTITSWILTGFSLSPESGISLTNQPHKLQVFQPFFISTNLPYSVKRGEIIAIPVIVFNYMEGNIKANVTLDNTHDEFEFIIPPGETKSKDDTGTKQTKLVDIESGSGVSKSFLIRPKKIGQITLKISAISSVAGDTIHQILRVDPEGVIEFKNKAVFFEFKEGKEHSQEISIEVPKNAVPDSTHIELSVVGDLLGPAMKNLDKLVRMPCGCGEQNMVYVVPNILILRYLKKMNKIALEIASKAKSFLEIGYQRELTYKHSDGSYSAFGRSDMCGSTWLTAYVARSFYEANQLTNIDYKTIKDALNYLVFCQTEEGNFQERGRIIDQHHAGRSTKGLALTAFTLLAFLENKSEVDDYQHVIKKGLEYLVNNIDEKIDNYALAISTYALQKANHEKKDIFLEMFNARRNKKDGAIWWTDEFELPSIEITAYGLLALLEYRTEENLLPVLKWLVSKRNSNGGFKSTQDTVVGLRAIVKFCEEFGVEGSVNFTFSDDKGSKGVITVNKENAMILQTHELNPEARRVQINGKGVGSSLIQVSYRYNIDNKDDSPRFKINSEITDTSTIEQIELSVCTSFIPKGDEKISNMAVMEVSLPSGYISNVDNLNDIEMMDRIRKVETKNGESVIVIYFDDLDITDVCFRVKGLRAHRVAEQKPSAIIVYDYYDNNRQARTFYEIKNISLNEISDGA